jgi:hypothetical protein
MAGALAARIMKSALIRAWKARSRVRERPTSLWTRKEGARRGTVVSGPGGVGGRGLGFESPSLGGQGDSKSHDTRASLTHYRRV